MNADRYEGRPGRIPKGFGTVSPAFSLIELLVVIAIIAVLVTMTILSVGNVGQGRKLTTAGNLTVDLINQARQVAKAKNTLTMLALITDTNEADAGRALTALAFSANGTNGTWSQVDKWRLLPEGIIIDQASSTNFFGPVPAAALPITRMGQTVSCSAMVFLPDGRALTSSSAPQVLYLKAVTSTNPAPSLPNYYKIIVNQATGIPIIRRP